MTAAAAAAQQPVLLVLLKGASALGYYTLQGEPIAKVPVGQHPHEMVVTADGRFAFVSDNGVMRIEDGGKGGNTVSVVDLAARKRVDTIGFGKFRRPHGLAIDPATQRVAVTLEAPESIVAVIDSKGRKILSRFYTGGETAHMVSFAPGKSGAEHVYVSNSGSGTVTLVQLTSGQQKTLPTGKRPEGSVISPDGKEMFVCNRDSNTISIIDTERQAIKGEIKTGDGPVRVAITPDGKSLIYACMRGHYLEFADLELRRPVARLAVDGEPISISVSKDGKYALAAVEQKDAVYVIELPARRLVKKFQVEKGAAPDPVLMVTLP